MNHEELLDFLTQRGAGQYGYEPVTQLAHMLQTAYLAERAHESPALITAALLHDLGHLVDGAEVEKLEAGEDDHHELRALSLLRKRYSEAVVQPVRLHVQAKRYLCAVEPGYWDSLSAASQQSLEVQGGIFGETEAREFIALPYAPDAVRLRRYDDLAKDPQVQTPPPAHFLRYLEASGA